MAEIPSYGGRRVRTAPLPGVQVGVEAPVSSFGGGGLAANAFQAAQGTLDDTTRAMAQMAEKEKRAAMTMRLSEKRRALNEWEYSNLYDPKTGALNKLGKNAFGIPEQLQGSYDKFVEEQGRDLGTDELREAYVEMANARRDHVMRSALSHVSQQTRVAEQSELDAGTESSKDRASLDPKSALTELNIVRDNTMRKAQALGMDAKDTALEVRKQQSDLHARVIRRLAAAGRDVEAQTYFMNNQGNLHGRDFDAAEEAVKGASRLGSASRLVESAFTARTEKKNTGGNNWTVNEIKPVADIEEFRASLPKDLDDKTRELAMDLARGRFRDIHIASEQRQDKTFKDSWNLISAGGTVSPVVMSELDPERQRALNTYAHNVARGKEPETNKLLYAKFYGLTDGQLRTLTAEQLDAKIRPYFSEDDYKAAVKHWGTAQKDPEAFKSLLGDQETMLEAFKKSGYGGIKQEDTIKTIEKNDVKAEAFYQFKVAVDAARAKHLADTKSNPDDEQTRKIANAVAFRMAKQVEFEHYAPWGDPIEKHSASGVGVGLEWSKRIADLDQKDLDVRFIKMPWDFRQKMFNRAHATPGAMARGATFKEWEDKNRGRINRAWVATQMDASDDEVYRILLGR